MVLALSNEPSSLVEKSIGSKGMSYPVGSGSDALDIYGADGIPHAYLIDFRGNIVWRGNPSGGRFVPLLDGYLDQADRMADAWGVFGYPEYLEKASELARDGLMGKAWKETDQALKRLAEEPIKRAEVAKFREAFTQRAQYRTDFAQGLADAGKYHEAVTFLEEQIKLFKGAPMSTEWYATVKEWKSDAEAKKQIGLDKKRLKALELALQGKIDKAKKEINTLVEKSAGLPLEAAMQEAQALIQAIAALY